jgi:hypothetical protein
MRRLTKIKDKKKVTTEQKSKVHEGIWAKSEKVQLEPKGSRKCRKQKTKGKSIISSRREQCTSK